MPHSSRWWYGQQLPLIHYAGSSRWGTFRPAVVSNLVGCVTFLDVVVSRDYLVRAPRRPSIRITQSRLTFLEPQGSVHQALCRATFIAWRLRHPFRGIPTGREAFSGMLGVSGQWSCAWNHFKKVLGHTRQFGEAFYKYRWFNKLINIWTDLTSFGYTAFLPSSISWKFSCQ